MDLLIGSHVSFTKEHQLLGCVEDTISYGGNTFMFYTGAPQNTIRMEIDDELTRQAKQMMEQYEINMEDVIVHAPYIINLANNKEEEKYQFAINFLKQERQRCQKLGVTKLVLHPGSHVSLGVEVGLNNIINALNEVLKDNLDVKICLEFMSGKGSECGTSFEQLKYIIDHVLRNDQLLVCLDTCHMSDAGLDIKKFNKILDEFDKIIGLEKLGCVHLNDSKNELGSHKDRHENLGFGTIGFSTLLKIAYNRRIKNVPKILETPFVTETPVSKKRLYSPYQFEINMIKTRSFNPNTIEKIRKFYQN